MSLKHLSCSVDVLFFHVPEDSTWLLKDSQFFEKLLNEYPISTLGVSVYKPQEVERMSGCLFELAFQFPFNVLDRRFGQLSMPKGKRYARSVFLQGLLASPNDLRPDAPVELINLQKEYHNLLADHHLSPVGFAVSFAARDNSIDHFLIGVDSTEQLQNILDLGLYEEKDVTIDKLLVKTDKKWLNPINWRTHNEKV
jgi:aryl-alcohol dehydrogenase-like predicted oxidoreductase